MNVVVVGLGNVGIPAAAALAGAGSKVVGIDIDPRKVKAINEGVNPLITREQALDELVARVVAEGRLRATLGSGEIGQADAVLICVDTPVDPVSKKPDNTALRSALHGTATHMKPGVLVSVESTLAPGSMVDVVTPVLEEGSGLKAGVDFHLVHCPERVTAGKLLTNLSTMPRVLGAEDDPSAERAETLYGPICPRLHRARWIDAELSKTVENAYRDVQLAFANEVGLLCEASGGNAFRVQALVNTAPDREMLLPGPGVGGHCLTKDSWLLTSAGRHRAVLIPTAREVNEAMPNHVMSLIRQGLTAAGKEMEGAQVLLLGGAYRENVNETSHSPALKLYAALAEGGSTVRLHDPHIPDVEGVEVWRDLEAAAEGQDCLVLVTPHDAYRGVDWPATLQGMATKVVVDCRGFMPQAVRENPEVTFVGLGIGAP